MLTRLHPRARGSVAAPILLHVIEAAGILARLTSDTIGSMAVSATKPTPVARDQFKVSPTGVEHVPTGYRLVLLPGDAQAMAASYGHLGYQLPCGDDYWPSEVETMAYDLWAEYLAQHAAKR